MEIRLRVLITALLISLTACAGNHQRAPVYDRYNPAEKPPPYYIVSRGDTLFAIAWRYGFDVQRLAAANDIGKPYTIYPGQAIQLTERSAVAKKPPVTVSAPPPAPAKPAVAVRPPPAKPKAKPREKTVTAKPAVKQHDAESGWLWPAPGGVVRRFIASGQAHKGIDIKGKMGEPVRASRSGVVVYAGSGLVGYGNLLILKHSDRYLSAYGHNRKLLVREGESVISGQKIAELGDSGTDSAKLHFEVRIDGKPVDPLGLLPKR